MVLYEALVYLAAVLKYMTTEVLELSGNAARDNQKSRISPRHIMLAVCNDEELAKYEGSAVAARDGIVPNIQPNLLNRQNTYLHTPDSS